MKRFLIALALVLTPVSAAWSQYVLNLREADIRAFIQDAARVTGRAFIIDPAVQGRVSVVTERPLSRSEYFELFLSTLRANGYVAVPAAGGALRIQPVAGAAASAPVRPRRSSPSGFVTEIFRVRNIEPAAAVETLRPLVSRDGSISASQRSIVVSDFADNVARIRQVLAQIDLDGGVTRVVGLDNAGAREIAGALAALGGEAVAVVPVDSANAVALRGQAGAVAAMVEVAEELDARAATGSEIRVVFLEHADASQLLPVLQQLLGQAPTIAPPSPALRRLSGTGGDEGTAGMAEASAASPGIVPPVQGAAPLAARGAMVTRFEGANALVIQAPADIQRMLTEVIRQLDVRREQVLVEAIIVEISDNAARQLGVQLLLAGLEGSNIPFAVTNYSNIAPNMNLVGSALIADRLGGGNANGDGGGDDDDGSDPDLVDALREAALGSIAGATGILGGGVFESGNALFGAIVSAVQSDQESNILSTPSIMTLDNQAARILVGQEIPVTTGEALSPNFDNAFRTVQRQNVGITLEVRPQINEGGAIKLDLRQEVSSIAGPVSANFADLILNKREIETTIVVDDGEIIGIGGLIDENERRSIEKVPVLGDIPVIGELFKSRGRARGRTNLMVFIRPTILRSRADARAMSARRYDYIRTQQYLNNPEAEPSLDQLVREYLGTVPPSIPAAAEPQDQVIAPAALPPSEVPR